MSRLEELQEIYTEYIDDMQAAVKKTKITGGVKSVFTGRTVDPRQELFHKEVSKKMKKILEEEPSCEEAARISDYILHAHEEILEETPAWYMLIAMHGQVLELVSFLEPAQAKQMYEAYEAAFPNKRTRYPVQDDLLKALKKRAKKQA